MAASNVQNGKRHEVTRESHTTFLPAVDIIETQDALLLLADVPGATADDIDVQIERGVLTLRAGVRERHPANRRFVQHEYGEGDFVRSFTIGDGIDAAGIQAQVSAGVLNVRLPKTDSVKPRKITVRAAN